jgi:hypothetical protein
MAKGKATDAQKSAKFRELAEKRVTRIIRGIAGLSKLSATSRYAYSPQQVEKMLTAIADALEAASAAFKAGGSKGGGGFTF